MNQIQQWFLSPSLRMRAALLSGPPGAGKTFFAEQLARQFNVALLYYQCHAWSSADELFAGVNVVAAVAGDADNVHQPGVLAIAAERSHAEKLVVCIDELDKAPEAVEALLLDWLQSGRVPVRPGTHLHTNIGNVMVVITTNDTRPLSDALLRRVRRVFLAPLTPEEQVNILAAADTYPRTAIVAVVRVCHAAAHAEGNMALSVQEVEQCMHETMTLCSTFDEFRGAVSAWACRTADGARWLHTADGHNALARAWAEVRRHASR